MKSDNTNSLIVGTLSLMLAILMGFLVLYSNAMLEFILGIYVSIIVLIVMSGVLLIYFLIREVSG